MGRRIQVVINPAAGRDEPVLSILNRAFQATGVDWDVAITKQAGDGERLARAAVAAGYDVVAAYGGDGTVREVAAGLVETDVPMAIFPGGTGNVMSIELGIPTTLAEAVAVACADQPVERVIDAGIVNGEVFLLRASAGFEARMVAYAARELKSQFGPLAYAWSAVHALADAALARYRFVLDGRVVEAEGMTAIVANVGSMGQTGLSLSPSIRPDDGLLDLVVVRGADLGSLLATAATLVVGAQPREEHFRLYQARTIEVEADPPQDVQLDGELIGSTPLRASVLPAALRVVVPGPAPSAPALSTTGDDTNGR